jgi:hypothetical protein
MDGSSRRAATLILAAAVAGLALRLVFALGYWVDKPLTRDEREYLSLARGIASGRGFSYDAAVLDDPGEPFGRAPGYPAFLAIAGGGGDITTAVPGSVKVAQSAIGAAGVVLVGLIGLRLGGAAMGAAAAWIAALYPPLVWISAYAFSEALFWPLGLVVAIAATRMLDRGAGASSTQAAVLCGVVTGICVLIRPGTLLFVPLAGVVLLRQRRLTALAIFAIALAVIVGPWMARNHAVHGRVMIASDGGVTFWTGNNALARGEGDFAANPEIRRASDAIRASHPGLTEEQMEPIYYREALAWIASHPLDWLVLEARKLFFLIVPVGPSYRLHSPLYHVTSVASYLIVAIAAAAGLRRLGRARAARVPGLWLLALSAIAVCLVFFPQERFRIPVIDPALVIGAGALLAPRRLEG